MPRNNYIDASSKVESGIILNVIYGESEFLEYHVKIENYHNHSDFSIGIPIFSFGYNSYTILPNSRVICLIKGNDYSSVFIIGQIYDINISRNSMPPDPGQLKLSSGGNQKSGITQIGDSPKMSIYSGSTSLNLDIDNFKISLSKNSFLDYSSGSFILKINEQNDGFNIKNGSINFITSNGFYINSNSGPIYAVGQKFSFTEGNNPKPNLLISKGLHRHIGVESVNIFSKYSFSASSGQIKGSSNSVDWNVTTGSYAIRLGTGDLKINLLNSIGAEVYFKIGIGPLYLSQFIFNQSSLEIKIGVALPDSLKLGGGSFTIKAGSFPGLQSEFSLQTSSAEISTKGIFGNDSIKMGNGSLTLKSTKILGGKGSIEIDGDVIITGELIVQDKIYSTDEVFAKASYTVLTGAVTLNAVKLSTHKHPTAVPGPISSPTPGT